MTEIIESYAPFALGLPSPHGLECPCLVCSDARVALGCRPLFSDPGSVVVGTTCREQSAEARSGTDAAGSGVRSILCSEPHDDEPALPATFGALLRHYRLNTPGSPGRTRGNRFGPSRAGMSQNELATRARLDTSYITLLERDMRAPSKRAVYLLADALKLSRHDTNRLLRVAGYRAGHDRAVMEDAS